jgi:hypothetical protein
MMNEVEFRNWSEHMMAAKGHWALDPVSLHNRGEYLYYCGDEADCTQGNYVEISTYKDGRGILEIGRYEDALPHIGEAGFIPRLAIAFPDKEAALKDAIETLGVSFLMAMTHGGTSPLKAGWR